MKGVPYAVQTIETLLMILEAFGFSISLFSLFRWKSTWPVSTLPSTRQPTATQIHLEPIEAVDYQETGELMYHCDTNSMFGCLQFGTICSVHFTSVAKTLLREVDNVNYT